MVDATIIATLEEATVVAVAAMANRSIATTLAGKWALLEAGIMVVKATGSASAPTVMLSQATLGLGWQILNGSPDHSSITRSSAKA